MATGCKTLRVVLGDQLSPGLSALADLDRQHDTVLMAEVMEECTYVRHHPKKIILVLSAMRHFARALSARGVQVRYVALEDSRNEQSLTREIGRAVRELRPERIVATEPGEWRVLQEMLRWQELAPTEIRTDDRFICSIAAFRGWARGRHGLRMEFFYRDMRRRTGILMEGDRPAGGRWNYDAQNRKRLPHTVEPPTPPEFRPDATTKQVVEIVRRRFGEHFGTADGFALPVTAKDAQAEFADFLAHRLPRFGDWQDAMRRDAPTLFHAMISPLLNVGLLDPLTVCRAAEAEWRAGRAPLNCVEGFIRQILGWREFMRGIYWLHMPDYATRNALGATRRLPWFYWSGETNMECLRQAIGQTEQHAYAHHIQRLMVTGNFALLAGIDPDEVDEWYMVVYADAYQWVEMPNTRGMALFADGGIVGSKPYAASGAYINRMSDYCASCRYDVTATIGVRACPFNALYWDFIARHADRFAHNPRMAGPVTSLRRMPEEKLAAIRAQAARFLASLEADAS